jgi:hypothetical protein
MMRRQYLHDILLVVELLGELLSLGQRRAADDSPDRAVFVVHCGAHHVSALDEGLHGQHVRDDSDVFAAIGLDHDEVAHGGRGGRLRAQDEEAHCALELHLWRA